MADDVDISQQREEETLKNQIAKQLERSKSAPRLKPNGTCHNPLCADDVAQDKLFCGSECAKQYQIYG